MGRKAEAVSAASAESLIDVAPVAIAMTDASLRIIRHSPAWVRELELGDAPTVGKPLFEVFADAESNFGEGLRRALAGELMRADAVWTRLANGRRVCLRCEASPWRAPDGSVAGLLVFVLDLTPLQEALERSRAVQRRLQIATAIADVHVFEVDYAERTITRHGAESFLDPIEFEAMEANPFCGVHEDDVERVTREVMEAAASGRNHHSEYRVRRADGREIWAQSAVDFDLDEAGELTQAIFALQNVTRRKFAERALWTCRCRCSTGSRPRGASGRPSAPRAARAPRSSRSPPTP